MSSTKIYKELYEKVEHIFAFGDWKKFSDLLQLLLKNNINIPEFFKKIDGLSYKISKIVLENIQLYNINVFLESLRQINQYGIFNEISFNTRSKELIDSDFQYNTIYQCINELFGKPSDQFLVFLIKEFPKNVIDELKVNSLLYFGETLDIEDTIYLLKDFLNGYTISGLNVRKISDYRSFIENYDNNKRKSPIEGYYFLDITKKRDIMRTYTFDFFNVLSSFSETHLINDEVLTKIRTRRDSNIYNFEFPIISMVVRGGLGPQGKGFAYLTPFNEICEICSDVKENKAYILEYKKFLKNQFMNELDKILDNLNIFDENKEEILDFLDCNIQLNIIDTSQIEYIFSKIDNYFNKLDKKINNSVFTPSFKKDLKLSIQKILLPIELQDQFMLRMNLIKSGTINEREISKLVSLGNVSHHDILTQRYFFLIILDFIEREYILMKKRKEV
ncbi:MAG: hypothetical protein ACTSPY_14245 [Candidatus Helarchaeota archaeon]